MQVVVELQMEEKMNPSLLILHGIVNFSKFKW